MKPIDFISKIAPMAAEDYRTSGVLPSLTIAQAILESNWGESGLTVKGNNLFGIKGVGDGGYGLYPTKEFEKGQWITINAKFAHYVSWLSCIKAHSQLLNKKRYVDVIKATDYKQAVRAVYAAGYATDPKYPQKLQQLIENYSLDQFDKEEEDVEKVKGTVQGKTVEGFVKDGVTYVPARQVGELLGATVKYVAPNSFDISKK